MYMYCSPTCLDIDPSMCQRVCMMKGQRRNYVVGPMLNANSSPTCFDIGPPMCQRVCMMKGQRKNCVVGPMLIAYNGPMLAQCNITTMAQHKLHRWPNDGPITYCYLGIELVLLVLFSLIVSACSSLCAIFSQVCRLKLREYWKGLGFVRNFLVLFFI